MKDSSSVWLQAHDLVFIWVQVQNGLNVIAFSAALSSRHQHSNILAIQLILAKSNSLNLLRPL